MNPAEVYRNAGLHPIVIHGVTSSGVCTCGRNPCGNENRNAGKHPVANGWSASPPAESIPPGYNVGLRMGAGLIALDEDEPGAIEALERVHGLLPKTLTQRSGSGGQHRVFRVPPELELGNRARLKSLKLDVRGEGGQIVVAPSRHHSGGRYEWLVQMEPAPLPEAWIRLLAKGVDLSSLDDPTLLVVARRKCPTGYDRKAFAIEHCLRAPPAVQGEGGHSRLLVLLTDLIVGLELDPSDASDLAAEHYNPRCQPPFDVGSPEWEHKVQEAERNELAREPGDLCEGLSEELEETFSDEGVLQRSTEQAWHSKENVDALARLKIADQGRYEATLIQLGKLRVARLRQLESMVAARMREIQREKTLARLPGANLLTDEKGRPTVCTHNVVEYLKLIPGLVFDEFSGKVVLNGEEWSDANSVDCAKAMQLAGLYTSPREVSGAIASSEIPRVHAVRDYLEGLPAWDGVPRLALLPETFGVESTELSRAYWRCWMISACRRVLQPGCKADCMLVLYGAEGIKKSTGFKVLGDTWFGDTHFDLKTKDAFSVISGKWIYEIAELTSVSKVDVERVKNFLSSSQDRYRPPYGRHAIDVPRQTVFCGTTNKPEFLTELDGDRRMWIMTATRQVHVEALVAARDFLWAEAFALARTQEPHWLPEELNAAAAADRDQYREIVEDAWIEAVDRWIVRAEPSEITVGEALQGALGITPDGQTRAHQMRLSAVLRALGWTRQRRSVGTRWSRHWVWVRHHS